MEPRIHIDFADLFTLSMNCKHNVFLYKNIDSKRNHIIYSKLKNLQISMAYLFKICFVTVLSTVSTLSSNLLKEISIVSTFILF